MYFSICSAGVSFSSKYEESQLIETLSLTKQLLKSHYLLIQKVNKDLCGVVGRCNFFTDDGARLAVSPCLKLKFV